MKLYRWYSETFNMSGVTAADYIATESDVVMEVEAYIDNTIDEAKLVDDLLISVSIQSIKEIPIVIVLTSRFCS